MATGHRRCYFVIFVDRREYGPPDSKLLPLLMHFSNADCTPKLLHTLREYTTKVNIISILTFGASFT